MFQWTAKELEDVVFSSSVSPELQRRIVEYLRNRRIQLKHIMGEMGDYLPNPLNLQPPFIVLEADSDEFLITDCGRKNHEFWVHLEPRVMHFRPSADAGDEKRICIDYNVNTGRFKIVLEITKSVLVEYSSKANLNQVTISCEGSKTSSFSVSYFDESGLETFYSSLSSPKANDIFSFVRGAMLDNPEKSASDIILELVNFLVLFEKEDSEEDDVE